MPMFKVDTATCIACGGCVNNCPVSLYEFKDGKSSFKAESVDDCVECMACIDGCPVTAISKA